MKGPGPIQLAALIVLACLALMAITPVTARDDDDEDRPASAGAGSSGSKSSAKDKAADTDSLFGFTEGSDTGDAGEREVSYGVLARKRTIINKYGAVQNDLKMEYSLRDDFKVGVGTFIDLYRSAKNFPPMDDEDERQQLLTRRSLVSGLSAEAKYRILERGPSPIGISVSFEPEWRRVAAGKGAETTLGQFQTKLMADTALVPERLFAALNASWEPQVTRTPVGNTVRDTNVAISAALTTRVSDAVYVGGEGRYLASFEGLAFRKSPEYGFFVGPTVYVRLSQNAHVSAAWSIRTGGVVRSKPDAVPDFGNVPDPAERHHAYVRFGYDF